MAITAHDAKAERDKEMDIECARWLQIIEADFPMKSETDTFAYIMNSIVWAVRTCGNQDIKPSELFFRTNNNFLESLRATTAARLKRSFDSRGQPMSGQLWAGMSPDHFIEHWQNVESDRLEFRLIGIKGLADPPKDKWLKNALSMSDMTLSLYSGGLGIASQTAELYQYNGETQEARLFYETGFGKPREWETFGATPGSRHGKSKRRRRVIQ